MSDKEIREKLSSLVELLIDVDPTVNVDTVMEQVAVEFAKYVMLYNGDIPKERLKTLERDLEICTWKVGRKRCPIELLSQYNGDFTSVRTAPLDSKVFGRSELTSNFPIFPLDSWDIRGC